jgi:membrane fusion protein
MDAPLFRPQSVAAKQDETFGPVSLASPLAHSIWVTAALLAATTIVMWLVFGHYTRRERVSGILVPHAGLVRLTARSPGAVSAVLVSEGDTVEIGQVLLRISGERSSQALGATGAGVADSLRLQDRALNAEEKGLEDLTSRQVDALRQSEVLLVQQLGQFSKQLELTHQQSSGYVALLERIRPLVKKGYVSQLQIQQQEAQAIDSKSEIETLLRQKAETARQLADVRSQLAQVPATSENRRNELRRQRAQLKQQVFENEAGRLSNVVATSTGIVSSLLAGAGQNVNVGEPLLSIVPASSPLEAQLLVPSSAVGFVHVGGSVRLHYVAFPYQKFGIQNGRVSQVSKSALSPNEVAAIGGTSSHDDNPQYRIRVALDRQTVPAYGKEERLLPGMAVEADLMLDRRTLLEWLLEPLFGARQRLDERAP